MGGGRVEGGEKRNFPWKHFPVYLTIVPPTKASQISPPINSKPARVPCCDLTASQMIQRMQHWAADIYFQFHVDLHPGGLGVLCLRVTGSVGTPRGVQSSWQRTKKMRALRSGAGHAAWLKSCHIMERSSTILPLILPLSHSCPSPSWLRLSRMLCFHI